MIGSEVQELGRTFREARANKGVTLTDAQQATKIRLLFLQALENDNYAVLPPPFYIRGFIKNYALYLGLNAKEMVQIFDELLETNEFDRIIEQKRANPSADSGGRGVTLQTAGLSLGEARLIEASNERLNVTTLNPTPTIQAVALGSADSSGETLALARLDKTARATDLFSHRKYILKPTMLSDTKGTFYMPNFIPALLVGIIVLAACLLVFRGLSSAQQTREATEAAALATTTAGTSYSRATSTPATTATPKVTQQVLGQGGGVMPPGATGGATSSVAPSSVYKPDVTSQVAAATTPATTQAAATAPPTTTAPARDKVTIDIVINTSEPKGSWLDVWVDGEKKVSKLVSVGDTLSFEGKKVAVRAGKPGAIDIKVNGEEKAYIKAGQGIITHTWYADGKDTVEQ